MLASSPEVEKARRSPFFEFAALVERRLIPAGPAYLAHVKRAVHKLTFEEHDKHAEEERKRLEALNGANGNGEDDLGVGDEPETEELLSLDPKEWKVRRKPSEQPHRMLNFLV